MGTTTEAIKLHLGCGLNAPKTWRNFDSSLHAQVTKCPWLYRLLRGMNLVNKGSQWPANVGYVDLNKRLPWKDRSADAIYLSHVLEHLSRPTVELFLAESFRVLKPGGVIRIVVPDMYENAEAYLRATDDSASTIEEFLKVINLVVPEERSLVRRMYNSLMGHPSVHKHMYDHVSLSERLSRFGFRQIVRCDHCKSAYLDDIELLEGKPGYDHSLYLEARKPG